jgi:hypothetical protein
MVLMEKTIESITISECPVCGKSHQYDLTVIRSSYLYGAVDENAPVEKRLRRLFTCAKKGNDFEATIILKDDPRNKIVSVVVEGQVKEEG